MDFLSRLDLILEAEEEIRKRSDTLDLYREKYVEKQGLLSLNKKHLKTIKNILGIGDDAEPADKADILAALKVLQSAWRNSLEQAEDPKKAEKANNFYSKLIDILTKSNVEEIPDELEEDFKKALATLRKKARDAKSWLAMTPQSDPEETAPSKPNPKNAQRMDELEAEVSKNKNGKVSWDGSFIKMLEDIKELDSLDPGKFDIIIKSQLEKLLRTGKMAFPADANKEEELKAAASVLGEILKKTPFKNVATSEEDTPLWTYFETMLEYIKLADELGSFEKLVKVKTDELIQAAKRAKEFPPNQSNALDKIIKKAQELIGGEYEEVEDIREPEEDLDITSIEKAEREMQASKESEALPGVSLDDEEEELKIPDLSDLDDAPKPEPASPEVRKKKRKVADNIDDYVMDKVGRTHKELLINAYNNYARDMRPNRKPPHPIRVDFLPALRDLNSSQAHDLMSLYPEVAKTKVTMDRIKSYLKHLTHKHSPYEIGEGTLEQRLDLLLDEGWWDKAKQFGAKAKEVGAKAKELGTKAYRTFKGLPTTETQKAIRAAYLYDRLIDLMVYDPDRAKNALKRVGVDLTKYPGLDAAPEETGRPAPKPAPRPKPKLLPKARAAGRIKRAKGSWGALNPRGRAGTRLDAGKAPKKPEKPEDLKESYAKAMLENLDIENLRLSANDNALNALRMYIQRCNELNREVISEMYDQGIQKSFDKALSNARKAYLTYRRLLESKGIRLNILNEGSLFDEVVSLVRLTSDPLSESGLKMLNCNHKALKEAYQSNLIGMKEKGNYVPLSKIF